LAVPHDAILVVESVRVVLNGFFGTWDPSTLDLLGAKNLIPNLLVGNLDDKGPSLARSVTVWVCERQEPPTGTGQ
jgi:hypothetical protein